MKKNFDLIYCVAALWILILSVLSFIFQRFVFTSLEEVHIFVYDSDFIRDTLCHPGGTSLLLGSFFTQFFLNPFLAILCIAFIYGTIAMTLCKIASLSHNPLWFSSLSVIPCFLLMLCFEVSSFEFRGCIALAFVAIGLLIYVNASLKKSITKRLIIGLLLTIILYFTAGPAAFSFSFSALIFDILTHKKERLLSLLYPTINILIAYLSYYYSSVPTLLNAFTPSMYYEMGSTYYFMLYALISIIVFMILSVFFKNEHSRNVKISLIISLLIFFAELVPVSIIYSKIHSKSNYENSEQRYYVRKDRWDDIISMPYNGSPTPFTSYRFLAMAKKGILADNLTNYRPFISYYFENKPKVKRRDQQVYSDIYYNCDCMASARHSAFDTDIVTPGYFNPYETQKLAIINIVYGDYDVAAKLLGYLEKTLYYKDWAKDMRKFLYNDSLVENDPFLAAKRLSIPKTNSYLSPKGLQNDLQYVIDVNPNQTAANQFLKAFLILTYQNETN